MNSAHLAAAIAVNRFGLGARPGELAAVGAEPRAWLLRQLDGKPPLLSARELRSSAETLTRAIELRRERGADRKRRRRSADQQSSGERAARAAAVRLPSIYRPVYLHEATARFAHAVGTRRPFLERLTHFWSNHFAVSIDKLAVLGLAGAMEREAIRPHVTGRFTDLLMAVEKHPAMLLYLDNHVSAGPSSPAATLAARRGAQRKVGINENLAREILELHTLGVNGGYTQKDVTSLALAISGWSVGGSPGGRLAGGPSGEFHFRAAFHEPGAKHLLGRSFGDDGLSQGESILRELAVRPATATHLATRLARHFIADDPPSAVIARMRDAWLESDGHLPAVYRVLIEAPEAWVEPHAKFKTPADYIHSAYRALDLPVGDGRRALAPFELLGQRTFMPGSPAGWPDTSADWDGSSALLKRIAWADAVAQRVGDRRNARTLATDVLGVTLYDASASAIARAESGAQALTLLLSAPEFMRR